MARLKYLWLALAVWGTVHPMYWFVTWFRENGFDIMGMVDAWHANAASSGLVWDLTIAAVTLTLWILFDAVARRDWLSLVTVPTIYCIGVSCGLPLYLYFRARRAV
ncbi:MAG: DUF2834 domain-containing protein [Rhodosalinus sp.]|uniref:DUF2834 domain-containing protein n=1 Tax=Rhodosalinus sp. TaxID=2047741 RepID=UPI00397C2F8F